MKRIIDRFNPLFCVLFCLLFCLVPAKSAWAKEERKTVPFSSDEIILNWDWNDFKKKSTSGEIMNLAIAGLAMSGNASDLEYGKTQSSKIDKTLKALGFTKIKHIRYTDEDVDKPAMSFAVSPSKTSGRNGKYVVVGVFRGTTLSHPQSIATDIKAHIGGDAGFQKAGSFALEQLKSYMGKNGLTKKNTILYLVGHSYGGAVASVVGMNCSDLAEQSSTFVYSYAAPDHYINGTSSTGNGHIYHYVNADDAVPRLLHRIDCGRRGSVSRFDYDKENGAKRSRFELAYYYIRGIKFSSDSSLGFLRVYNDKSLFRDHMDYTYMAILLSSLGSSEISEYFPVVPEITSCKSGKGDTIKVKWKQVSHVDGYEYAWKKDSGDFRSMGLFVKDFSGDTFKKLSGNGKYSFRVRSFVEIGSKRFFSGWSKEKSVKINRKISIKLNKKTLKMTAGDSAKLKAVVKNTDKAVSWKSSDKSIATVSRKGKVKAKKAGTAVITASVGKKKAACKVTVKKKKKNTDLKKYYRKPYDQVTKTFKGGKLSTRSAEYNYYSYKGGISFAFPKPYSKPSKAPVSSISLRKKVKGYSLLGVTVGMGREKAFEKLRKNGFKRTVAVGITYYWKKGDLQEVSITADDKVQSISYGAW